ncbi:MAG: Holliday junction branch migration protein RuvA [bacterium]|nr:Holliday junction branch migration protein RuvA [bacterium]
MINYICGTIKERCNKHITLEVGPIGLAIQVPDSSLFVIGDQVVLQLHLHWNAEQGPSLYGFRTVLDRTVFILITSCSGVGPKITLAILEQLGTQGFLQAIQMNDEQMLSKVSGIGIKRAEQIIVQLKDKVNNLLTLNPVMGDDGKIEQWHTLTQALQSLNYSRTEITRTMNHLKTAKQEQQTFDQLMRQALSFLSKQSQF